jgi:hypothetical protein
VFFIGGVFGLTSMLFTLQCLLSRETIDISRWNGDSESGSDVEGKRSPVGSEVGVLPEVSAEWK